MQLRHVHAHAHKHTHTHTYTRTRTRAHVPAHAHVHAHTYMRTRTSTRTRTYRTAVFMALVPPEPHGTPAQPNPTHFNITHCLVALLHAHTAQTHTHTHISHCSIYGTCVPWTTRNAGTTQHISTLRTVSWLCSMHTRPKHITHCLVALLHAHTAQTLHHITFRK